MPWGGAYNRVAADTTAFVHRDEMFQLKHSATVHPDAPAQAKAAAHAFVRRSWETVHPWGSGGVFPAFPDRDLAEPAEAYYGSNLPRLRTIKARYDPTNLFQPPSGPPSHRADGALQLAGAEGAAAAAPAESHTLVALREATPAADGVRLRSQVAREKGAAGVSSAAQERVLWPSAIEGESASQWAKSPLRNGDNASREPGNACSRAIGDPLWAKALET